MGKAARIEVPAPDGMALSRSSIARRLAAAGTPTLGRLLREARVLAVEHRIRLGMSRPAAVIASAFTDIKLYEKARSRQKQGGE